MLCGWAVYLDAGRVWDAPVSLPSGQVSISDLERQPVWRDELSLTHLSLSLTQSPTRQQSRDLPPLPGSWGPSLSPDGQVSPGDAADALCHPRHSVLEVLPRGSLASLALDHCDVFRRRLWLYLL